MKGIASRLALLLGIAALVAALDLGSKAWAEAQLSRARSVDQLVEVCSAERSGFSRMQRLPTRPLDVVPGLFRLKYAENCGGPFGFLKHADPSVRYPVFVGATVLALAALVVVGVGARGRPAVGWALALLAGGAIGNVTDRIRLGYVVDFIDLHAGAYAWPTFNLADVGVTAGLALMVLDALRAPRDLDRPARHPDARSDAGSGPAPSATQPSASATEPTTEPEPAAPGAGDPAVGDDAA